MRKMMDAPKAMRRWLDRGGPDGLSEMDQVRTMLWFFEEFRAARQVDVWSEPGKVMLTDDECEECEDLVLALRRGEVPVKYADPAEKFCATVGISREEIFGNASSNVVPHKSFAELFAGNFPDEFAEALALAFQNEAYLDDTFEALYKICDAHNVVVAFWPDSSTTTGFEATLVKGRWLMERTGDGGDHHGAITAIMCRNAARAHSVYEALNERVRMYDQETEA